MSTPSVGQAISVVVKNTTPVLRSLFPDTPDTLTYVGTVVQRDEWLSPDYFGLTTNDSSWPKRMITMNNVVSIDGAPSSYKPVGDKVVIVKGSKGNEYTITVDPHGKATCTCPGFLYHGGQCKHVNAVLGKSTTAAAPNVQPTKKTKPPSATTGKKKLTKMDQARDIFKRLGGNRQKCIRTFIDSLDMSSAAAATYHYNIKKEK